MRLLISILICIAAVAYHQRQFILPYLTTKNITTTATNTTYQATTNTTMAPAQSTFKGLPVIPPNDPSLTATTTTPRKVRKVFEAIDQAEGAGARVRRSVGTRELKNFTPFLMLVRHFLPFSLAEAIGLLTRPSRTTSPSPLAQASPTTLTAVKKQSPTSSAAPSTTKTLPAIKAPSTPETFSS